MLTVGRPGDAALTGLLNASGGSLVNPTHIPANLQISSSYAGANGVLLSGGAGAYLSVYAPQTSVGPLRRLAGLRRLAREDARALGRLGCPLRHPAGHRLGEVLRTVRTPERTCGGPLRRAHLNSRHGRLGSDLLARNRGERSVAGAALRGRALLESLVAGCRAHAARRGSAGLDALRLQPRCRRSTSPTANGSRRRVAEPASTRATRPSG